MKKSRKDVTYIGKAGRKSVLRWQALHYAERLLAGVQSDRRFVQLIGQMQIGKTEIIEALAYLVHQKFKGRRRVYVVSPIPLLQLREQDAARFSNAHLTYLDKFATRKRFSHGLDVEVDAILLIDESHWGSENTQVLARSVIHQVLKQDKIKLALVSATPFNTLFSEAFCSNAARVLVDAKDFPNYVGIEHFLNGRRVTDISGCRSFYSKKKKCFFPWVETLFLPVVKEFLGNQKRKVFLVRTETRAAAELLERLLRKTFPRKFHIQHYNQREKIDMGVWDLQEEHSIIFLQGLLTVGTTVPQKGNIWGIWEHYGNQAAALQALTGRMCGHWSPGNDNRDIRLFVCKPLLDQYLEFVQTGVPSARDLPHTRVHRSGGRKAAITPTVNTWDVTKQVAKPAGVVGLSGRAIVSRQPRLLDHIIDTAAKNKLLSRQALKDWRLSRRQPLGIAASAGNLLVGEFFDTGRPLTGLRSTGTVVTVVIENRPGRHWKVILHKRDHPRPGPDLDLTKKTDAWGSRPLEAAGIMGGGAITLH